MNEIEKVEALLDETDEDITPVVVEEDSIIYTLVDEFAKQRNSLNEMIIDLEKIKAKIDTLFPESMDKRYIRFFEEKMKAMTSLFGTILDIKKEIMKGLKTEIDLRKNLKSGEEDENIMEQFDIRKLAVKVEQLQKNNEKQKKKRINLRTKGEEHVRINE